MIFQLLDINNEEVASGTFEEMIILEQKKRSLGGSGFIIEIDYFALGYAFYKSDDKDARSAINTEFMLGFVTALAEYPDSRFKTIRQAFEAYWGRVVVDCFVRLAKEFRENQEYFVRWPNLKLE